LTAKLGFKRQIHFLLTLQLKACTSLKKNSYTVFHGFGQAKLAYGSSILDWSQFTLLPQLPLQTMLDLKVVKIDSKIIILLQ